MKHLLSCLIRFLSKMKNTNTNDQCAMTLKIVLKISWSSRNLFILLLWKYSKNLEFWLFWSHNCYFFLIPKFCDPFLKYGDPQKGRNPSLRTPALTIYIRRSHIRTYQWLIMDFIWVSRWLATSNNFNTALSSIVWKPKNVAWKRI